MNKYDARFNAVKKWYVEFMDKAHKNKCTHFQYEGDMIELECLVLNESGLNINYITNNTCSQRYIQNIFDSTIEYDNGMHTNIKDMYDEYLSKILLFKEI